MATTIRDRRYELGLLALLTFANGVVGLDRLTASFLSPYIIAELKLDNTQLGLLAGSLSLAVALSSIVVGRIADRTGRRKAILVTCTLVFSAGSALGGLASGFGLLFLARFALGLAEGPMVPVGQSVMVEVSAPERRGFNMGIMQMVGAFLLGGMIGPVLATQVADVWGWRAAFFLSGLPGLLLAIGLAFYMRETRPARHAEDVSFFRGIGALVRIRNMRLVVPVSILFSAWLMVQNVFLPVYLTEVKHLAPAVMGWVVGMGGLAGIIGGVALPGLSDRIGRRPVLAMGCLFGVVAPIALMLLPDDPIALGLAVLIGWLPIGIAPLFCAVVPSESVPPALLTSAIGLSMGSAELLGGVAAPFIAGRAADSFGLGAPLWMCLGLAVAGGLLALLLEETAPALRRVS